MPRARHFVNVGQAGETVFATTKVLDFVHAFDRDNPRAEMVRQIIRQCRITGSTLQAFVVMPHHIHLLVRLGPETDSRRFMQRLKESSAKRIRPMLWPEKEAESSMQRGLNRCVFWQRSFRSLPVESEASFWQKVRYIHENPVRAGMANAPEQYPWSSARAYMEGLWSEDHGLPLGNAFVGPLLKPQERGPPYSRAFGRRLLRHQIASRFLAITESIILHNA